MKFSPKVLLIAVLVIGCNNSQELMKQDESKVAKKKEKAVESAGNLDVCSLVSKDQIADIVGEQIGEAKRRDYPKSNPQLTISECSYVSSDGFKSFGILVRNSEAEDNAPDIARQVLIDSGAKVENVSGLSDVAFWSGVQLQVFKGKKSSLVITVMGFEKPKESAIRAAEEVLKKL